MEGVVVVFLRARWEERLDLGVRGWCGRDGA